MFRIARALWLFAVVLTRTNRVSSVSCACSSIGTVHIMSHNGRDLAIENQPDIVTFMNATDLGERNSTAHVDQAQSLFPLMPRGLFACSCSRAEPLRIRYLVSAVDASGSCLGTRDMGATCDSLRSISVMNCTSHWISGMSGTTFQSLAQSGLLLETVRRLMRAKLGVCADTVSIFGAEDTFLVGNEADSADSALLMR